jgi:hypothetical protein
MQLQSRKKRKIQGSPNSRFITIEDIMRTQIKVRERLNILLDSEDTITLAFILSHITIEE